MTFKLDRREVDRFADRLRFDFPKAAQAASATALTETAAEARSFAQRNIRARFTVRNKWTEGSVKSTKTPVSRPIDKQFTLVGSKQPYMAKQSKGGDLEQSKQGRRITTARGSREGATAYPRTRVARGRYATRNIKTARTRRVGGSRGGRAFVAVMHARRMGHRFIYLRLRSDRAGIFEVQKRKIVMVHRVMKERVSVKPTPWLKPAVMEARKRAPLVFKRTLERRFRP